VQALAMWVATPQRRAGHLSVELCFLESGSTAFDSRED
jgi:hypothetical protein